MKWLFVGGATGLGIVVVGKWLASESDVFLFSQLFLILLGITAILFKLERR